jgi:hypothetical protein
MLGTTLGETDPMSLWFRLPLLVGLLWVSALAGPAAPTADAAARVGRPAPAITGGPWLNSPPLSMTGLRGRVVLVEFWTFG